MQRLCALNEISVSDLVELIAEGIDVFQKVGGCRGLDSLGFPLQVGNAWMSIVISTRPFIRRDMDQGFLPSLFRTSFEANTRCTSFGSSGNVVSV